MAECATCGNNYDKSFEVIMSGKKFVFDCFECAIHMLAPRCQHCSVTIIGHGLEAEGRFFCCAYCAAEQGEPALVDRVD